MAGRRMLALIDELLDRMRGIQQSLQTDDSGAADDLAEIIEDFEEVRKLTLHSRSKAAEGITAGRRLLRDVGIAPPPFPRELRLAAASASLPYTIEFLDPVPGPCVACGAEILPGPVGCGQEAEEGPICDVCLKDRCPQLAIFLHLVNAIREFGEVETASDEEYWMLMANLLNAGRTCEANMFETWVPFLALELAELEELLAKLAYRNEDAVAGEEPTGVN